MIVLDCCAVIELVEQTKAGLALQSLMLCNEEAVSVDLLSAELTSVIRKQVLRGEIERDKAGAYLAEAVGLVDRFVPAFDLQQEALSESLRLNHSSYDMFYFVLARRCGATLFTTDQGLAKLCLDNGVNAICKVDL